MSTVEPFFSLKIEKQIIIKFGQRLSIIHHAVKKFVILVHTQHNSPFECLWAMAFEAPACKSQLKYVMNRVASYVISSSQFLAKT
jgi:hypothetical protein